MAFIASCIYSGHVNSFAVTDKTTLLVTFIKHQMTKEF